MNKDIVRKYFDYDEEAGNLIYKEKLNSSSRVKIGSVAGSKNNPSGYVNIKFNKKMYKAHRLIWLWVFGEFPDEGIDHINHIKNDNRLCNLRPANQSVNNKNKAKQKNNTSGQTGVYVDKEYGGWFVLITADKQRNYLGRYQDYELACFVACEAYNHYGFHKSHGEEL